MPFAESIYCNPSVALLSSESCATISVLHCHLSPLQLYEVPNYLSPLPLIWFRTAFRIQGCNSKYSIAISEVQYCVFAARGCSCQCLQERFPLLEHFCLFVRTHRRHAVTEDTWAQVSTTGSWGRWSRQALGSWREGGKGIWHIYATVLICNHTLSV